MTEGNPPLPEVRSLPIGRPQRLQRPHRLAPLQAPSPPLPPLSWAGGLTPRPCTGAARLVGVACTGGPLGAARRQGALGLPSPSPLLWAPLHVGSHPRALRPSRPLFRTLLVFQKPSQRKVFRKKISFNRAPGVRELPRFPSLAWMEALEEEFGGEGEQGTSGADEGLVGALAAGLYGELERLVGAYGPAVVAGLLPQLVAALEGLEQAGRQLQDQDHALAALHEDQARLLSQYERERAGRARAEEVSHSQAPATPSSPWFPIPFTLLSCCPVKLLSPPAALHQVLTPLPAPAPLSSCPTDTSDPSLHPCYISLPSLPQSPVSPHLCCVLGLGHAPHS